MTQPKPESLLELVERLDDERFGDRWRTHLMPDEWSRLRDALRDLAQAARSAIRLLPHPTSEEASTLEMEIEARGYLTQALARLDNPHA